jgi:hypothetical protein
MSQTGLGSLAGFVVDVEGADSAAADAAAEEALPCEARSASEVVALLRKGFSKAFFMFFTLT